MDCVLSLFPLNTVLLPGAMLQLHIFEDRYKDMMAQCMSTSQPFGVVLDRSGHEVGDDLDPVAVGTAAAIRHVTKLSAGRLFVIAQGTRRFRIDRVVGKLPFWRAEVSFLEEVEGQSDTGRLRESATLRFRDYLEALLAQSGNEVENIELPSDAAASSYIIADALVVTTGVKQKLLEATSVAERLHDELQLLEEGTRRLRALRAQRKRPLLEPKFPARFSLN